MKLFHLTATCSILLYGNYKNTKGNVLFRRNSVFCIYLSGRFDFCNFKIQVAANLQAFLRHPKVVHILKMNGVHTVDVSKVSYCIHTCPQILLDRAHISRLQHLLWLAITQALKWVLLSCNNYSCLMATTLLLIISWIKFFFASYFTPTISLSFERNFKKINTMLTYINFFLNWTVLKKIFHLSIILQNILM